MTVLSDNPIRAAKDDAIGRILAAKAFAGQVLALDASEGVVVGVLGPWGSGKTSFVNLARPDFEAGGAAVLDFNPWMFSGAEQLVESFFIELSAQLKVKRGMEEIGKDLAEYGEAFAGLGWLPFVGSWIERGRGTAKVLSKYLSQRQEGTQGSRRKLTEALSGLEHPIIVVLDDIDRLSTREIRDVFKLVRLTASFPNVSYVLAFDRARVESALGEEGVPGRDYLEKILQVAVDLPQIPEQVLNRQVFDALNDVLLNPGQTLELDERVWPDVFMEVVKPLIRNMRDVRRYAAAVQGTVEVVGDQVALADLLGAEAIRVFLPDVFARLPFSIEGLCTPSERLLGGRGEEPPNLKAEIEGLVSAGGGRADVVRALIDRLFPFGQRHVGGTHYNAEFKNRALRDRRIGHEAILRLYLERVAGEELTNFYDAERAWQVMDDRDKLDTFLRGLEAERQEEVIGALETYQDEYRPEHVVPASIVLSNLLPDLPERPRAMFELDSRMVVGRVVYRLLRSLGDPGAVKSAMDEVLPEVSSLSAKWELVSDVGYREGAGHKLVSEVDARDFEIAWRQEVRTASVEDLAKDHDLVRVLIFAIQDSDEAGEPGIEIPSDATVTLAVLGGAKSETRSQYMGTRSVRREARLAWETLEKIYGDEATLVARIEALKAADIEVPDDLEEVVDKYLSGWRPRDFDGPDDGED
jgi:KAP family P-loop domain